jgi:3-oxoacyl-[acyl-carrier protein] reductase
MTSASVLITGAGIGIGAACAAAFAAGGYRTVLTDVLESEGEALATRLRESGYDATFRRLDVTDTRAVQTVVRETEGEGFDAVVANAGIARRRRFLDLADADWAETLDVDLQGEMRVFRAAVPAMVRRGSGALVALSSVSGAAYGWAEHAHYSAAKAGVIGLARALAVELGPHGIRANALAPGFVRTAQSLDLANSMGEQALRDSVSAIPLRRVGEPAEIADVAFFLASPAARYLTGQVLVVDGGLLVQQG